MKNYALAAGVFVAFALVLAGAQELAKTLYVNNLEQKASDALSGGDYLASLEYYTVLDKSETKENAKVDEGIAESKNLLVAEEMLAQARKAKDDGNWFAVKALLEDGYATTNNSFKDYEEAVALYVEAAEKVRALEEKIESELMKFRQEAAQEKARRENAEQEAAEVKEEVLEVKQALESTIREKEQTSAELQATAAQKQAAEQQAARERFLKFLNELALYVNMLERADGYLNDALSEIEQGKDTSAPILLLNGKVLFEEVKTRAEEMHATRTEEQYKSEVRVLLQSAALFIEAAKAFGGATAYIDQASEQDKEQFFMFFNQGRAAHTEAVRLLNATREFITRSRQQSA